MCCAMCRKAHTDTQAEHSPGVHGERSSSYEAALPALAPVPSAPGSRSPFLPDSARRRWHAGDTASHPSAYAAANCPILASSSLLFLCTTAPS